MNFGSGDNFIARPGMVGIERHEFDETHDEIAAAGEFGEGLDFIVVDSSDEDGVDLDGTKRRGLSGVDAGDDMVKNARARDAFESGWVERIEADVDAVEAGGHEIGAMLGEAISVGRHRKVARAESFQASDEVDDAGANERLAAGDANFADAHADEDAGEALVFVPRKEFVLGFVMFGIGGAAIDAAKIAAVGDRQAKVGDGAAEFVRQIHVRPIHAHWIRTPIKSHSQ